MKENDVILASLNAISRMSKDLQIQKEKRYEKMFVSIKTDASLKDFLSTLTKSDLDDIRQNFQLSGLSSLKKSELIDVLSIKIRENLPFLLNKLIDKDYNFIMQSIKNAGIYEYDIKYRDAFQYLRNYGIMHGITVNSSKYFVIPTDLQNDLTQALNKLEVINNIKLNNKIYKITKGLLFYYGILKDSDLINMINSNLKPNLELPVLANMVFEFNKKDTSICYKNNYFIHNCVKNDKELLSAIEKRPLLNYCPINITALLQGGEDNFIEWNSFDETFFNYIINNFDITADKTKQYILDIKNDYKNGVTFSNSMNQFGQKFRILNFTMAEVISNLLQEIYSNTKQWILKGYSPIEIYNLEKSKQKSIQMDNASTSKSKLGRNDYCPCGSGKKYKNCCLKSLG